MKKVAGLFVAFVALSASLLRGELDAGQKAKVDAAVEQAKTWAADPKIVSAVKAFNTSPSDDVKSMTQDKWKTLPVLDPFIRAMTKNDAAAALKSAKTEAVAEAFVSGADGKKVAFLNKPSNWSHGGKPKHDDPMANKVWIGDIEVDESTGQQQIQVAVPVLDGDKPVGSLVVGFAISKL